jgi:DNA-binding transcriptional ArsR family regulator
MNRATPQLLPILRSQQQGEILALIFAGEDLSPTQIAERTGFPYASVHREIERAEQAGLIVSRRIGRTRLISPSADSPYLPDLGRVLVRAFGPPYVLADALRHIGGIDRAVLFGSWAAHATGHPTGRPVADIDLLVLGEPDRDDLYAAVSVAETRLGRPIQVVVREPDWWDTGTGAFHDDVTSSPVVELTRRDQDDG